MSGAGDTVIATLAAGLAGGLAIETAVELANVAAGIVVGKVGTVPIARNELISALTPSSGSNAARTNSEHAKERAPGALRPIARAAMAALRIAAARIADPLPPAKSA